MTANLLDISGIGKPKLLVALHKAAETIFGANRESLTLEAATQLLSKDQQFDVLLGRRLCVDLSNEEAFDPYGYNAFNGHGAAENVVAELRKQLGHINVGGIPIDELLTALYNAAKPSVGGREVFPHLDKLGAMILLNGGARQFDDLYGRQLGIVLGGDWLDPQAYDAANGARLAEAVIALLRISITEAR